VTVNVINSFILENVLFQVLKCKFLCRIGLKVVYLDVNGDNLKASANAPGFSFSRSAEFLNIN